jgi:threonine dehydratase
VGADALGARRIGELPWSILAQTTDAIVVDDASVTTARCDLWSQYQLVAEPAAAVTLAALQTGAYRPEPGERVVAVVCGGNTIPPICLPADRSRFGVGAWLVGRYRFLRGTTA